MNVHGKADYLISEVFTTGGLGVHVDNPVVVLAEITDGRLMDLAKGNIDTDFGD
jgi:hypothetical protein